MNTTAHAPQKVNVIAIAPHPDDAEICCGGTLLTLHEKGYATCILDLTQGELGTNGDINTRKVESAEATKILGLTHRENLAFKDGGIDPLGNAETKNGYTQLTSLVERLRELQPEVILAPYERSRHPDHAATSALAKRAAFMAGLKNFKTPKQNENTKTLKAQVVYYQMRYKFQPSFIVDISSVYERKLQSIKAYQTQLGLIDRVSNQIDETLIASSDSLAAIEAHDKHTGSMIGTQYGEAFLLHNTLSISDPVAHFRMEPGMQRAMYF